MIHKIVLNSREDWLNERTNYIGGSEASAIVGMNPYMSNTELWEQKTGRTDKAFNDNAYMEYGRSAEDHLRALFALDFPQYKVFYEENNLWTNDTYPFAHASLDGWLEDKDGRPGILEIKTTNILKSMQYEKWKGRIPDNYYIQIIHYLMVTGFDFAVLHAQLRFDYPGDETVFHRRSYFIERSEVEADIEYLAAEEAKFYEYWQNDERPPLELPNI